MEQKFSQNGKTIVFYQKENDTKFSFKIENEPELTEQLLSVVKTKRVKEEDIHYSVSGIFERLKIIEIEFNHLNKMNMESSNKNPIVVLAEKCQKMFGKNIETRVIGKTGSDHCPEITVEIELPNGDIYTDSGSNQRIAKQKAAEQALLDLK